MTRRNRKAWLVGLGFGLALAAGFAAPATAQETAQETAQGSRQETVPGAAAEARLDFTAALEQLGAAIDADPTAPGPRLARAALHVKMQRPALALADLGAILAHDPANVPALRARVEIWDARRAWNRARADLDAALAAAPDNAAVLALRAGVNERAGMIAAARADYEAAHAAAPDDAAIAKARDALLAAEAERNAARVTFGPEAVMSRDFIVEEGDGAAANTLYVVHAATDLADELTEADSALIARAVDAGALRVVHLFTYTGNDADIWGNLALICAGQQGLAATHAALSDAPGRAALDAAGTGDIAPLERLLTAAYSVAGIDEGLVSACALDRLRATRYLADWQSHRDAGAWRGVNLLDTWPAWVLNGTSLGPGALSAQLEALVPAPAAREPEDGAPQAETQPQDTQRRDATSADTSPENASPAAATHSTTAPAPGTQPPAATGAAATAAGPTVAAGQDAVPAPAAETGTAAAAGTSTANSTTSSTASAQDRTASTPAPPPAVSDTRAGPQTDPRTHLATGADTAAETTPGPIRFPQRPTPVADARVPVELRGIYAPSLAACLTYLDAIETPPRIDAVLPGINPLDGPALGTILVTSRRIYLFNPLDTECAIAGSETGASGWQGRFACASPLAPDAAPALRLSPAPTDGGAPRVSASFGAAAPVVLRQCRALGQLGKAFAPLWTRDGATCTISVPVEQGRFAFSVDGDGNLVLRVAPRDIPAAAGRALLRAVIDGAPFGETPGRWDGTGWQTSLGPLTAAAERLGWGMFLDLRTSGAIFEARLPLFGSGAAMKALAGCAVAAE